MFPSKEYFAAAGGENLFTQPLSNLNLARSAMNRFFTQPQAFFKTSFIGRDKLDTPLRRDRGSFPLAVR